MWGEIEILHGEAVADSYTWEEKIPIEDKS